MEKYLLIAMNKILYFSQFRDGAFSIVVIPMDDESEIFVVKVKFHDPQK
jgi:hypothetical protein